MFSPSLQGLSWRPHAPSLYATIAAAPGQSFTDDFIQAGLVGHFTLAAPHTPKAQLTARNRQGGQSQPLVNHLCQLKTF